MTPIQLQEPQHVAVLGSGAWGIVLASILARKGHHVTAWDPAPQVVVSLQSTLGHPKLPGFKVPDKVTITNELAEALSSPVPDCVVAVAPSHGLRSLAEKCHELAPQTGDAPRWVICSKGIEEETLLTMTQVVESVRGAEWHQKLAALSGPTLAAEVALGKPTTICATSDNPALSEYVQALFITDRFRVYTQDDMMGVELGGALKNVIAIASGACDALELGNNARAALITRGLAEMVRLGIAMGARAQTFAGLTGMGDLIVTCSSNLSRNHQFGGLLARGYSAEKALNEIGMVVEGMRTARSANALAAKCGVEMPIARQVHAVIYEGKPAAEALADLMQREARPERD